MLEKCTPDRCPGVDAHRGLIDAKNVPQIVMISSGGDQGSLHAAQGQWRHPESLGEFAPHPSLINQGLADVERHASDLRRDHLDSRMICCAALRSRPNTFVELAGVNHFGAASQLADASTAVSAAVLDHIRSNSVTGVLATGGG